MPEEQKYVPVACDYHDQLEAASMHKRPVLLEFELDGVPQNERGTIADVYTSHGGEFVKFASETGTLDIRLDHIISFKEL